MCPDWELNWQPFGSQAGTQFTEPHQPGLVLQTLMRIDYAVHALLGCLSFIIIIFHSAVLFHMSAVVSFHCRIRRTGGSVLIV